MEFSGLLGIVDGRLIRLATPDEAEEAYVGRKGGHAVNVGFVIHLSSYLKPFLQKDFKYKFYRYVMLQLESSV